MRRKYILPLVVLLLLFSGIFLVLDLYNDNRPIGFNNLPSSIVAFLNTIFPNVAVNGASIDFLEYEVWLNNGIKIEFDTFRNWEKIESHQDVLPLTLIPQNAINYILNHYPEVSIQEISQERFGFEIGFRELNYDLKFSRDGSFYGIDD